MTRDLLLGLAALLFGLATGRLGGSLQKARLIGLQQGQNPLAVGTGGDQAGGLPPVQSAGDPGLSGASPDAGTPADIGGKLPFRAARAIQGAGAELSGSPSASPGTGAFCGDAPSAVGAAVAEVVSGEAAKTFPSARSSGETVSNCSIHPDRADGRPRNSSAMVAALTGALTGFPSASSVA